MTQVSRTESSVTSSNLSTLLSWPLQPLPLPGRTMLFLRPLLPLWKLGHTLFSAIFLTYTGQELIISYSSSKKPGSSLILLVRTCGGTEHKKHPESGRREQQETASKRAHPSCGFFCDVKFYCPSGLCWHRHPLLWVPFEGSLERHYWAFGTSVA